MRMTEKQITATISYMYLTNELEKLNDKYNFTAEQMDRIKRSLELKLGIENFVGFNVSIA